MEYVQARFGSDIVHGLVRCVRRGLIHNDYQMSILVMLQHLPQKLDHFLRTNSFFVQFEDEPA